MPISDDQQGMSDFVQHKEVRREERGAAADRHEGYRGGLWSPRQLHWSNILAIYLPGSNRARRA